MTVPVTPTCQSPGRGTTLSAARVRSPRTRALGRKTRGCGPQVRPEPAAFAPVASGPRGTLSVPRDAEGAPRVAVAANGDACARARTQLRCGVRARALPARAVLDPERSPARDRRGDESAGPRQRDEIHRITARASRDPDLRTPRLRACRPLPRACAPLAARGEECAGLRPSQCATTPRKDGTPAAFSSHRPRIVRAILLRLESKIPTGPFP